MALDTQDVVSDPTGLPRPRQSDVASKVRTDAARPTGRPVDSEPPQLGKDDEAEHEQEAPRVADNTGHAVALQNSVGGVDEDVRIEIGSPDQDVVEVTQHTNDCSAPLNGIKFRDVEVNQPHHQVEDQQGSEVGGIRFAPWNVPVRRRLQTMAVMVHSLSLALTVSLFFFLCAIPFTWPILIPYLLHMLSSTAATDGSLRFRSERLRRSVLWKFFADYFPATLHKTHDLPPTRKYIFGYHPHGIISHGAFAAFATEACGFGRLFPGITNSLLTLDSNFRIPLYRDYMLALGLRSVSKESIGNVLTRGGPNGEGMGRAVTIVVGGARESLEAQPGNMRLILKERKGFIKLALRTGADLVPVLAFGENELYDQLSVTSLRRFQMFVLRTLKFTMPFLHGRGIFNYDVGLMPYRRPLHIVVGAPIHVAQASHTNSVDPADVDRLHALYVAELCKIWDTYKDKLAADRKEELQILK